MGVRHQLAAYDHFLTRYRSWAFLGFTFILLALAVVTLFTVFGWAWPATDHFGNVTLTDEVTAMLATGTLALAYAALVQATSAERQRNANLLPSMLFGVALVQPLASGGVMPIRENDPGQTQGVALLGVPLAFTMRSTGPGPAIGVRVGLSIWKEDAGPAFPQRSGTPSNGPPSSSVPAGEYSALAMGDEKFVSLNDLMGKLGVTMTNSTAGAKVAVQLVLQVKWRATVPGWGPEMARVGIFMSAEGGTGAGQPTAKWTVMTQRELGAVVGVPDLEYPER